MCRNLVYLLSLVVLAHASIRDVDNEIDVDETPELDLNVGNPAAEVISKSGGVGETENGLDSSDDDVEDVKDFESMTLDEAFDQSVQSYLDNDFYQCITGFTNVIQRYKEYRSAVIRCRTKCRKEVGQFRPIMRDNIEDMHFYEKKVRETLCLLTCNQDYRDVAGSQALKRISRETEQKLMDLAHYEYLHICYYQKSRYQDAVNAIYTYLIRHPKHEMSVKNMRYYLSLPEVKDKDVVNLEAAPFVKFYMAGVAAYEQDFYKEAVESLEESLVAYLRSEDECRIYCEGPFDQGWLPEFTSSIANHFTYCLKCKRHCSQLLNNVNGDYMRDLLATHYNYLQFAYYKLGDLRSACEAAESYLLFLPADETMINNKEYYLKLPKAEENWFTPRDEALAYVTRQEYELRLLRFVTDEFAAIDERLSTVKKNSEEIAMNKLPQDNLRKYQSPLPGHSPSSKFVGNTETAKNIQTWREAQTTPLRNITILSRELELGGKFRYLAEGLLNQLECESLIQLAEVAAVEGDGYTNNKSPHSKYEIFKGLTVGRVALMVYFGLLDPKYLELFLQSSESARAHAEDYFKLNRHLYFSYTHLVCRSALPEAPANEIFSHDVHADNCLAIKKGVCLHQSPAFTWRDYSAVIYLNDDFEGGEFIFAADPKAEQIQSTIFPACGRMVGFSADEKNLHGVKGVRKGRRCALALWFTMDKDHIELERRLARVILDRVTLQGPVKPEYNVSIPLNYEKMLARRFKEDKILKFLLEAS